MAHITYLYLSLILLFLVHKSHQWNFGRCPSKHYVQSFRDYKWQGKWYEYARKETPIFETYSKCNRFDFGGDMKNSFFSMVVPLTQSLSHIPLEVKKASETDEEYNAHFTWSFKFPLYTSNRDVYILSTNFYDWALVWSCEQYLVWNYQTAWILVRERPPKMMAWVSQAIHKAVGAADLDIKDFTLVSQENCESTSLSDDNGVEAMETFVFPYEGPEENLESDDADNS